MTRRSATSATCCSTRTKDRRLHRRRRRLPRHRREGRRDRPGVVPGGAGQGRDRLEAPPVDDQGRAEGRPGVRALSGRRVRPASQAPAPARWARRRRRLRRLEAVSSAPYHRDTVCSGPDLDRGRLSFDVCRAGGLPWTILAAGIVARQTSSVLIAIFTDIHGNREALRSVPRACGGAADRSLRVSRRLCRLWRRSRASSSIP